MTGIRQGDFVLVEYTLTVKETGELVDTTDAEEARAKGIYDERERYGPRLVIVGEGRLVRGLEEALEGRSVGDEFEVEIPPEKAYGQRDPSKVRILPKSVFTRQGVVPEPGKTVEINGQYAVIRQVTGGRVIVDFNHPLAGKTLRARVRIVRRLETVEDKVKHLILRRVKAFDEGDVAVHYDGQSKTVTVRLGGKALAVPELQFVKRIVAQEVQRYLGDSVEKLVFVEEVELKPRKEGGGEQQAGEQQREERGEA